MRRNNNTLLILSFLVITVFYNCSPGNDWENEEMVGINKEPARATSIPYENESKALSGILEASSFYQSLNGTWKFNWVSKPSERTP
ncbi:MAG: hypothetical protein M3421_10680 [Bacteroidota bacterium]|nr:hypothetical protein [Bacteroidota bacterium]